MFNETHCKPELEPSDWSVRNRRCKVIYYWFALLKATWEMINQTHSWDGPWSDKIYVTCPVTCIVLSDLLFQILYAWVKTETLFVSICQDASICKYDICFCSHSLNFPLALKGICPVSFSFSHVRYREFMMSSFVFPLTFDDIFSVFIYLK